MNIIELEEGLRNLISTQPNVMSGNNAHIISGLKSIIEAYKIFNFRIEEYPEQDILKVGVLNQTSSLEMNLVSYACQILQERGINIMLYVPKYAAVYDQTISKYVDNVIVEQKEESVQSSKEPIAESSELKADEQETVAEKYIVVDKNEQKEQQIENKESTVQETKKPEQVINSKTEGRDYLMNLLKN